MIEFHDRRAEKEAAEAAGVETRADGSLRRPGKGGRTMSEFWAPEHLQRGICRQDYMNLRASEEFSRRESTWWRRVWRFLRGVPQVRSLNRAMASAHERQLQQIAVAMEAERRKQPGAVIPINKP